MRDLLVTQRWDGGFGQKLHVQKADCQLAAKGAATQRSRSGSKVARSWRSGPAVRPSYLSTRRYGSGPLNFAAHSLDLLTLARTAT
jgi:hypothetical protein